MVYEGKSKKIFETSNPDEYLMVFKDDLTAFNAQKKGSFEDKGRISQNIAEMIYEHLSEQGFSHHWLRKVKEGILVQKLNMIPLEVVVRNYAAGSLVKNLGWNEGDKLSRTILEFYFKNDELGDPTMNEDHILAKGILNEDQIIKLRQSALELNKILVEFFISANLLLVDFKAEFGFTSQGYLVLGDDISPDCFRAWDPKTFEKFDKDLFRFDLGDPRGGYQEIEARLKTALE
jgi:phosphoribosylaminoimidazole-succinocarboxamide synthase